MRTDRENKGNNRSGRLLGLLLLVVILLGGACSGKHAMMTAPYEMEESTLLDSEEEWEAEESDSASENVTHAAQNVGNQIFKISDMLFAAVDSLGGNGR